MENNLNGTIGSGTLEGGPSGSYYVREWYTGQMPLCQVDKFKNTKPYVNIA